MEEDVKQRIIDRVGIIPEQVEGTELIIETAVSYSDEGTAKAAYLAACQRMIQVNQWSEIIDGITAKFQLHTDAGEPVDGIAKKDLLIQVDLPAPGTLLGRGYDWVHIEEYAEGQTALTEFKAFRVRPTYNPTQKEEGIAHFYAPTATVTWVLYREHETVHCIIFDRNLQPNTEESGSHWVDLVRNSVLGTAAAGGMSKVQWEKLVKAILQDV